MKPWEQSQSTSYKRIGERNEWVCEKGKVRQGMLQDAFWRDQLSVGTI
jgi:hypothetical protein